jgi:hypothetical protein
MKRILALLLACTISALAQSTPKAETPKETKSDQKPAATEAPPAPRPAPAANPTELLDRQLTGLERGLILMTSNRRSPPAPLRTFAPYANSFFTSPRGWTSSEHRSSGRRPSSRTMTRW